MAKIDGNPELREAFAEGKMLGILVASIPNGQNVIPHGTNVIPHLMRDLPEEHNLRYLAAFSGSVGGRSFIEGFVPPIFDLLDPSGHFKVREAEITAINHKINSLEKSSTLAALRAELAEAERDRDEEIGLLKAGMAVAKRERDEIRCEVSDPNRLAELIRESQYAKAELRRLKLSWEERIGVLKESLRSFEYEIEVLKEKRARMSDELQEWIFRQYIVHNSLGEEASVYDIFAAEGLVPPGGTGDCAAPKLLEYAFRKGLEPVAMGEFWYGASPETAVRTHGHFYPSCTSKCGPLLRWMMRGMEVDEGLECEGFGGSAGTCGWAFGMWDGHKDELETIYEDEALVAVNKPSGMPSVPGLDGRVSAFEILKRTHDNLFTVHRLDMDTSGILLFAKDMKTMVSMQKQFENHTIRKTYRARLSAADTAGNVSDRNFSSASGPVPLNAGDKGRIELPLSPDYDERPRQKVDFKQGKPALTEYEVVSVNGDGTSDILFRPHTGRTHQLRVHAAHTLGLARPILGDPLYGGSPAPRLHLHASGITFLHPSSERSITLNTSR